MIMVTHEMAFAREVSSQVLFLHKGRWKSRRAEVLAIRRASACASSSAAT
jgi:ABC-type histidine transport system ATPase subunit